MIEIDLWADEQTEASPQTEASVFMPAVKDSEIVVQIDGNNLNLYSKMDLTKGDFEHLINSEHVSKINGINHYQMMNSSLNSFVLRHALKGHKTVISPQDGKVLGENANKVPNPKATLDVTRTNVKVVIPNLRIYRDMLRKVDAYAITDGSGHRIAIGRVLDLEAIVADFPSKLPKILFSDEVLELNREPIYGYSGTLMSLKTLPLDSLNIVAIDKQTMKSKKASKGSLQEKLASLGINNLHDLMFWLPRNYIDKSKPQDLSDLIEGETAVILGRIETSNTISGGRGADFLIRLNNGGSIKATFFNQQWLLSKFKVGSEVLVTGKFKLWNRTPQIAGTLIEFSEEAAVLPIVPVYKQSPTKGITTNIIMNANRELISRMGTVTLPPYLKESGKMTYFEALTALHFPESLEQHSDAIETLAFYELVRMQVLIQEAKEQSIDREGISITEKPQQLQAKAIKSLPFELTRSQKLAIVQMNKKLIEDLPSSTLLSADVGAGKGLLETAEIPTPNGSKLMRNIIVGDYVIGSNGLPTRVTGVFPQGSQKVARITFSDQSSIVTDLHHLWEIYHTSENTVDNTPKIVSTGDLLALNEQEQGISNKNISIPVLSAPVEYDVNETLSIDPYVMGVNIARDGLDISNGDLIPQAYMLSSPDNRVALLQGLLDTAGSVDKEGNIVFSTVDYSVTSSIVTLINGLGGIAQMSIAQKTDSHEQTIDIYSVIANLPNTIKPFRFFSKSGVYNSYAHVVPNRYIIDVQLLDEQEKTICIKVSADDELFVADVSSFIVTHNTIIAQMSALQAVDGGYQAVIIGPTETLARQLYETFLNVTQAIENKFGDHIEVGFLSGSMKVRERKAVIAKIADGSINIVVGTHALMSDAVVYKNLGFIAIDEQQKFGAEQRTKLLSSRPDGLVPDLLMQTATPIPRSMSQIYYGDIDMIQLKEKPKGRLPIITEWVRENPIDVVGHLVNDMWADVINEATLGNQTFVIAPLVVESDKIDSASVEGTYKSLSDGALSSLRVGFIHGKMKADAQRETMDKFRAKEYDVLVASTVVEVGVDISDATRVVILSADRLGSSSLHQIRGRVGRNSKQSKCYLVSVGKTENSQLRLQSLVDNEDGFKIAQDDLGTRGEGTMFSTVQSGSSGMIFASLLTHGERITEAKEEALSILNSKYRSLAIRESTDMFKSDERLM